MTERKSYFAERTEAEIRHLALSEAYSQHGLVARIATLSPDHGLVIRAQLIPGHFCINTETAAEASRKCYKHGDLLPLSAPVTQQNALACRDIPLAIRALDFSRLETMREEDINYQGYSWYPVQGKDRRKRVVPFTWLAEGLRLFAYAENMTGGIKIQPYADSARVKVEGADIVCTVPSRTKKKPRYKVKMQHVPTEGTTERRAVIWSLKSSFEVDPEHSLWNMRYTWEQDRETSDRFTFYPHDIAAYLSIAKNYWKNHNITPMEMNPFALLSQEGAEFYKRLCNNVLIVDPTVKAKEKLRKLHVAEKSILLGRAIGQFGHDDFAFWDPERDGKLRDYDWKI